MQRRKLLSTNTNETFLPNSEEKLSISCININKEYILSKLSRYFPHFCMVPQRSDTYTFTSFQFIIYTFYVCLWTFPLFLLMHLNTSYNIFKIYIYLHTSYNVYNTYTCWYTPYNTYNIYILTWIHLTMHTTYTYILAYILQNIQHIDILTGNNLQYNNTFTTYESHSNHFVAALRNIP